MRKLVPILVSLLVVSVAWIFFKNFTVTGLEDVRVEPRLTGSESSAFSSLKQRVSGLVDPKQRTATPSEVTINEIRDQLPRIRVGTFNVQALDQAKISKPQVLDLLARIGREFDVLAVQEIRSESDNVLPVLVHLMNKTGQQYDYAIGPRVGPKGAEEQYAFIFNRRTLVLDRSELYTVDDRSSVLTYEPFVGWFRAVGPPDREAFTFSLINLRVDPATAFQERDVLDDLLVAVRDDGRNEDDVILAGDLQAGPGHLGALDQWADVGFAVSNVPTDVAGTAALDNLVFHKTATSEFTGNSGVLDFLRKYNLTIERGLRGLGPSWPSGRNSASTREGNRDAWRSTRRRHRGDVGPRSQLSRLGPKRRLPHVRCRDGMKAKTPSIPLDLTSRPSCGSILPGILPVSPLLQILAVGRRLVAPLGQPLLRVRNDRLLFLQRQFAGQDATAEKDEIGVQHIAAAIVVDLGEFTVVVEVLDHVPLHIHLAGLPQQIRRQVQSAVEARRTVVDQQVLQVQMGVEIVAIAGLVPVPRVYGEPVLQRHAIAKGRQLQQRHIEGPPVETDQRRLLVSLPAPPELLRDQVRSKVRFVQQRQVLQTKVIADLGDHDRDGNLKRVRDEVDALFFDQFRAITFDRLLRRQLRQSG